MKPYVIFWIFALLAGFGQLLNDEVGDALTVTSGLAALILPLLMILKNCLGTSIVRLHSIRMRGVESMVQRRSRGVRLARERVAGYNFRMGIRVYCPQF